jgi:hypothetical protein
MDNSKAKGMMKFQVQRNITCLYKQYLMALEDFRDDLRKEGVNISDETFQRIRKRVLDNGNDCIRELQTLADSFDIRFPS